MSFMLIKICRSNFGCHKVNAKISLNYSMNNRELGNIFILTSIIAWHILINTNLSTLLEEMPMKDSSDRQSKYEVLRRNSCLNPHPDTVRDELFGSDDFFDPYDLPQVKYEMLRRVRHEKKSVSKSATDFGFSRVAFYQAQDAFEKEGLCGLLPRKRGPKERHKLTAEVMRYVNDAHNNEEKINALSLAQRINERFGIRVHPRSIQRALAAQKKKLLTPKKG